ncbi:hypothetical protein [Prosthecobacter sp.]|uniref:DUF7035 domain-containing protein n=1 Tax=Prosthecobacter sp. TaxID=1965333 RepID=UPI003784AC1C
MTLRSLFVLLLLCVLAAGSVHAVPPSNDSFATRTNLGSGASLSISGDNTEATLEAGETTFGSIAGSSVWYEWTAPASGWVNVSTTVALDTDTVLGVFTGSSVAALTQLGFNDDAAQAGEQEHWSSLTFLAIAGTSYKISVSGYDDGFSVATGAFTLTLAPSTTTFGVNSLSFSPASANVTNAAASLALNLTASSSVSPVSMRVRLIYPTGLNDEDETRYLELPLTDAQRISGTAASGSYQLPFTLPRYVPPAGWKAVVFANNGSRDARWSYGADTLSDDFALPLASSPTVTVTNTGLVDNAPPVLTTFTASSTSINGGSVAESGRVITFQFALTDDLSGFSTGSIELVSSQLPAPVAVAYFSTANLTSGNAFNGAGTVSAVVPYGLAAGTYDLRVRVLDASLAPDSISNIPGVSETSFPDGADSQITITGTAGYPAWASTQLFPSGKFGPDQDEDGDGLSNLLEYAFSLNPAAANSSFVITDTYSGSPPAVSLLSSPSRRLSITFLRRKAASNSGLTYSAQFCDTLLATGTGGWTDATGTPVITSIDDTWELVVIEDTTLNAARRFGRVKIIYAQP